MHFVGPDQLHGFEERLTTDIYPADFGWTPDYRKPGERIDWWYHNLGSVTGAGVAEITNQIEYDDEVAFLATQKLYDLARHSSDAERPALVPDRLLQPSARSLCRAAPVLGSLRELPGARSGDRLHPVRAAGPALAAALSGQRLCRLRHHARSRSAARGAAISPASPTSTTRSANWSPCSSGRACSTIRSSCSAPTTATCSASAACGSRCASSKARCACR